MTRRQQRASAAKKNSSGAKSTAGMLLRNSVKTTKVSRDKHPSKAARVERAKKKK